MDKKHNFYFDAEFSNDDLRDDILFAGLRYGYKFGKNNKLSDIEKRMTNRVVRDIDIVSPEVVPSEKQTLKDPATNESVKIKFVDLGAEDGGIGTLDSPFNNFENYNNKFAENDIVYNIPDRVLTQEDRDSTSLCLLDGQKFVASNQGIKISDITGNPLDNFMIARNTSDPMPKIKSIFTANQNLIQGFDIKNSDPGNGDGISGSGIVVDNKTGVTIRGNSVSGSSSHGIYIANDSSTRNVSNNVYENIIDSNNESGIFIRSKSDASNYIAKNVTNNNKVGIDIISENSSSNRTSGNLASNNGLRAIKVSSAIDDCSAKTYNVISGNAVSGGSEELIEVSTVSVSMNDETLSEESAASIRSNLGLGDLALKDALSSDDLSDISDIKASNGQVLVYNSQTDKYEPRTITSSTEGGNGSSGTVTEIIAGTGLSGVQLLLQEQLI